MIWFILGFHAVVALVLALVGSRLGRQSFWIIVAPPLAAVAWTVSGRSDDPRTASVDWVPGLDLVLAFRIDPLAELLTYVVAGVGVLVFVYATDYVDPGDRRSGRLAATLLAFAGSMLGLVWADSVWALFICWELTSITSFLLIGHHRESVVAQAAARRALLITVAGGLALLAGLVLLVDRTGTAILSDMGPMSGGTATAAGILVVVAAATKSAQVPFHVWLPGAMTAPTPVSAYLHSATMVKAGLVLLAVTSPILAGVDSWSTLGIALGSASMVWGAVGALRQTDAKLILAWGTISQLGMMFLLLATGDAKATFAAIALLTTHAMFKAALFMVVGDVDVRTGERDIRRLGGLASAMPIACVTAVVAGASMAGLPTVIGFASKEAAIEAALGLSGVEQWVVLMTVVGGSLLTVAYTTRLVYGMFGPGPECAVDPRRPALTIPPAALAALSLAAFAAIGGANRLVVPAAESIDPNSGVYELLRWPGLSVGLGLSLAVLVIGAPLGVWIYRRTDPRVPEPVGAETADAAIDGSMRLASRLTARVQHGSLPVYIVTMALTASAASLPFAVDLDLDRLVRWDAPAQLALGVLVVTAAAGAAVVGSRLGAALGLGAVGVGVSGLFLVQGAPDLALTQLLVETIVVAGFVLGLGHLTRRFPPVGTAWRGVRVLAALGVGVAVAAALVASGSDPSGRSPVDRLEQAAVDEGGGDNVVNVILTDIRALDTLGEIIVLLVVAVGVLALARARRPDEPASTTDEVSS